MYAVDSSMYVHNFFGFNQYSFGLTHGEGVSFMEQTGMLVGNFEFNP